MTQEEPGALRSVLRNPFLWAFLIGIVMLTLMRPLLRFEPPPPPVIAEVPPFTLVDSAGDPFGSRDLADHVYVASFFFTSCKSICPALMRAVGKLQDRYRREKVDVRLISITVDPEHDTPELLREYGRKHGVDPSRWTLLTGPPDTVREIVEHGFLTPMGERTEVADGIYDIAHSAKLVLVDGQGGIRGYYNPDKQGLDEVFHRSIHVLKAGRGA